MKGKFKSQGRLKVEKTISVAVRFAILISIPVIIIPIVATIGIIGVLNEKDWTFDFWETPDFDWDGKKDVKFEWTLNRCLEAGKTDRIMLLTVESIEKLAKARGHNLDLLSYHFLDSKHVWEKVGTYYKRINAARDKCEEDDEFWKNVWELFYSPNKDARTYIRYNSQMIYQI